MPRRARLSLPGVPLHVIQRGNNRQACFYQDRDRRLYLEWLADCAEAADCAIHAYVLMSNHVHLLLTPAEAGSASALMKALGQRYVQYINRTYERSGSLWEGRFRSCLIQDAAYLLTCHRYIELNPVRARMVAHPAEYCWSSYRDNAQGRPGRLLRPHPLYLALGNHARARQSAYGSLFQEPLADELVDRIRSSTNGNFALGNTDFTARVEALLQRRAIPGASGRPRKA
ncbi:MAG: transposase [Burkholderiaceae bacterium]|nr:transposase [Burkholderiaceae bacterium]